MAYLILSKAREQIITRLARAQVVFKVARWHDDLLAAKDPVLTLRLAGGLCLLALLSNIFRC